ncbi:hypothetical protein F0U44_17550 [Nocardioides humilatus]|uniref:Uncharacterized protein n=1 Tax=Nocardioides humilatus TaxID=2607660 RepID=A0A5B1L987_9ACTN|nr:hypothetical protein [Nocardioides humilatus]KAA1416986.1 hypothetical protein F0U44_17550 [Nocardioides humilatus]
MKHHWGARLRAVLLATTCALALAACDGKPTSGKAAPPMDAPATPSSTSATPTTDPSIDDPVDDDAPEGEVAILDHGDGDRVLLALQLTEGDHATTTMQMTLTMRAPGVPVPPIPMTMTMSSEVVDVADDVFTVQSVYAGIEIDDAGLPAEMVDPMRSAMSGLDGMSMTFEYGPTGEVLDTDFDLPDDAPPTTRQMLEQLTGSMTEIGMAFPDEPIGEGATWRKVGTTDVSGASMVQTTTYHLDELDGLDYRVSLETTGTLEAPDAGSIVTFANGSMTNTGRFEGSLTQVLPLKASTHGVTRMGMEAAGQRIRMTTTIDIEMTTETD